MGGGGGKMGVRTTTMEPEFFYDQYQPTFRQHPNGRFSPNLYRARKWRYYVWTSFRSSFRGSGQLLCSTWATVSVFFCGVSHLPNLRIVPIPHTFRWPAYSIWVYIAQCFMLFHVLVECLKGCLLLMWFFCNVWRGAANPKLAKLFAWNFEPMNNTFTHER